MIGLQENLDTRLVEQVREGDEGAFAALYNKYNIDVNKYLTGMVTREEAEEVLQETFIKAFRGIGVLQEPAKFQSWLYRIARNCAYDFLRRRRRHIVQSLEEIQAINWLVSGDDPLEYLAEEELMRQALDHLPTKLRECFVLQVIGKSPQEIADLVGLSEASVPIYQGKAKRSLQERYRYLKRQSDGIGKEKLNEGD